MVTYQLKIELIGSHPSIWRRITLPSDTPFDNFHDIIQIVMGWNKEFAYEFTIGKTTVRDFQSEIDLGANPYDRDATSVMSGTSIQISS